MSCPVELNRDTRPVRLSIIVSAAWGTYSSCSKDQQVLKMMRDNQPCKMSRSCEKPTPFTSHNQTGRTQRAVLPPGRYVSPCDYGPRRYPVRLTLQRSDFADQEHLRFLCCCRMFPRGDVTFCSRRLVHKSAHRSRIIIHQEKVLIKNGDHSSILQVLRKPCSEPQTASWCEHLWSSKPAVKC